jgi:hypothetical protein
MDSRKQKKSDRFSGCDLIGTITDTASFVVSKYAVNPGLASTFPWLAVEAAQWNEYRLHKCKFSFVTRSATSQVGTIILAPNYDASDPAPTLESQLGNYADSVEDTEWKDIECPFDPESMHPMGPRKFIRTGAVPGDIKTYDVANFYLSTDGATTNVIGKLYVEYDVEFFDRIVVPSAAGAEITSLFLRNTSQTLSTGVATTVVFNSTQSNPLGIVNTTGSFVPPAGAYLVRAMLNMQDSSSETFSVLLDIDKNGSGVVGSEATCAATGTVEQLHVAAESIIVCNGTDAITIVATPVGVAGTLTIPSGLATVSFVVA